MSNYAVTLNCNCHCSYVEYNEADKTAVATLASLTTSGKITTTVLSASLYST